MPSRNDQIRKLTEAVGPLECRVELPESWASYFERRGQIPSDPDDRRRYPRSHLPACAGLRHCRSLPALPRDTAWHMVYTKDVSRTGLAFLHSEQLFPAEQVTILLLDGRWRAVEVVRCRRVQDGCFDIGAVFIAGFRDADTPEGSEPSAGSE
jgi:hypothetical protein